MRLLIVSIILACNTVSCAHTQSEQSVVSAQSEIKESEKSEIKIAPNILDRTEINNRLRGLRSTNTTLNNIEGIWFPKRDAERLLSLVEETLPQALDIIDHQTKQIEALDHAIKSYKESIDWYIQYANHNRQMLDISLKNFRDFQQPQYAWYENRIATYIYGILSATAVLLTSAYLLDQIQP